MLRPRVEVERGSQCRRPGTSKPDQCSYSFQRPSLNYRNAGLLVVVDQQRKHERAPSCGGN
jgi:hypothetical protein